MTDQAPELLPCPFCGSADVDIETITSTNGESHCYMFQCNGCETIGPGMNLSLEEGHERWNTRPTPAERPVPQVREALEELPDIVERLREPVDFAGTDPLMIEAADLIDRLRALTARPSDAAVAWRWRIKDADGNVSAWEISSADPKISKMVLHDCEPLYALPPDEPAREKETL